MRFDTWFQGAKSQERKKKQQREKKQGRKAKW